MASILRKLDDGGRLINLAFITPDLLDAAVRGAWFALLQSFTLETPKGSRFSTRISLHDH